MSSSLSSFFPSRRKRSSMKRNWQKERTRVQWLYFCFRRFRWLWDRIYGDVHCRYSCCQVNYGQCLFAFHMSSSAKLLNTIPVRSTSFIASALLSGECRRIASWNVYARRVSHIFDANRKYAFKWTWNSDIFYAKPDTQTQTEDWRNNQNNCNRLKKEVRKCAIEIVLLLLKLGATTHKKRNWYTKHRERDEINRSVERRKNSEFWRLNTNEIQQSAISKLSALCLIAEQ